MVLLLAMRRYCSPGRQRRGDGCGPKRQCSTINSVPDSPSSPFHPVLPLHGGWEGVEKHVPLESHSECSQRHNNGDVCVADVIASWEKENEDWVTWE